MPENTPLLNLPYLAAAQAQKHVTHNEALRMLDAIVQIAVESQSSTAPPSAPQEGERYIITDAGAPLWNQPAGSIAAFQDGYWEFYTPKAGWVAYVLNQANLVLFDGTDWVPVQTSGQSGGQTPNNLAMLGINSVADTTNRLSVASPATLLSHDGNDHRMTINKAGVSDTASMIFQSGFSGRAEMGLAGDDGFAIRVSADGTNWLTALAVDPTQAAVTMPSRPFFRAAPAAVSPAPGYSTPLPFSNVLEQTGTAYNPSTATFTAPVAGLFCFGAVVRFDSMPVGGYARLFFKRNGSEEFFQLGHTIAGSNHSSDYHSLASAVTTQLAAGDTVTLHGGHIAGGDNLVIESCWYGYLV